MSNFRELVNANIPKQKTKIEIENEKKDIIRKDAEMISDRVRKNILDKAQKHGSGIFSYKGVLSAALFTDCTGLVDTSTIFSYKKEQTIRRGKYADLFIKELKNNLSQDEIKVSELMFGVCKHSDIEYLGRIYSLRKEWWYELCEEYGRGYDFSFIGNTQSFDGSIREIIRYSNNHFSSGISSWYYNKKLVCSYEPFGYSAKSDFWIGVRISYR